MPQAVRRTPPAAASRRDRRVQEVHDRILQAAMQRFAACGVEATKVDEICALADVVQKTFFNHFPTKQHLLREIAAGFLDELLAILATARQGGGTTAQQLERFFKAVAASVEEGGAVQRHFVLEVIRLAHDERANVENIRHLHAAFGALLRDGVRAGDVTSAHSLTVLTEVVVGAFNTLMLNWLGLERYPFRARAMAMSRFLAAALRAPAA
jgi:AcrR family transcriptional regulator